MSLSVQFLSLLAMIGTGIVTAAFIDMIGTGTSNARKNSLLRKHEVLLEFLGWIIAGCWAFYILYIVRDGAWRIYDPIAQLSGILLYASFFHKPFRFFGNLFRVLMIKPILFVVFLIYSIISFVLRFVWKVLLFLMTPLILIFSKLYEKFFQNRKK